MLLFSSLGLMVIASPIRLQSSAGLIGFCYIMLIGVVFALSQNFPAFGIIHLLIFEHHFINGIRLFFDWLPAQAAVFYENLIMLAVMGCLSIGLALWIWRWRGWRQP